uniref:Large ribosomal subunit protein uL22c n=3 Tax=Tripterospermum TaxID=50809 RepID=A0A8F5ALF4_9GENT|nr:ribosomal protein L22 [Tripterospermum membranaceum]YP_010431071.1 ribosomal protein L22 [Tripterospermum japonicum]QXI84405.1 ribosomal protein L22 [Tripterospermum championii]QXI84823.1 ribosomal protein L22 [Tripterospermum luteoviride]QNH70757.1 ribosomal protein L22 [Tripterospermum membranaceum]USS60825.1 ribosomal protein L22 [Tripterospermum japonicum]
MITKEKKNIYMVEVYAFGQHIPISPDKARRVIDQIRGRSYEETLMILELMSYRACYPIFKLVCSAASNASYKMSSKETNLIISKAEVNASTSTNKLKPRARGRSYPVKKSTCHISIVMKDISFDNEYRKVDSLKSVKKMRRKKKHTTIGYHNMYSSEGIWDKK